MRTKVYTIVMRSKDPEKIIDIFKPAFECYGNVERIIIEDTGRPDIDIYWIFRTTRKNFKTINRIWNDNGWTFKKIKDIFLIKRL